MKKGFPYFPRPVSFAINGNFCTRDRRNFCMHDRRNFLIFAINGILEFRDRRNFCIRDRRNFVIFAIDGIFIFCDRRIKRSNQAIAMSDRRIKRSKVSITLKIRDREFLQNWNSGIPGKRSENKKNPIPPSPQRGTKRPFSRPFFFIHPRKRAVSPF